MLKWLTWVSTAAILTLAVIVATKNFASAQNGSRLDQAFRRVDADGDGKLTQEEIGRFAPLVERLRGADANADGSISLAEFNKRIAGEVKRLQPTTGKLTVGDSLRVVRVADTDRRYRVHLPKSYDAAKPTPVVIAFHGGGGNLDSMIQLSGLSAKADESGFIVAYPYGSGRDPDQSLSFNGGGCCGYAYYRKIDDIEFIRALLDDLAQAANIDDDRIFATGISNGAIMAYYAASELSDRIAAIAPVAGPMMTDSCRPVRPVSVMHFHGTADRLAPFNGGKGEGTDNVPAFLRPEFKSVDHSIQNWVKANGCDREPKIESLPNAADDGMRVTRKTWDNGRDGAEVVLFEIEGGGHTWPGMTPPVEFLGKSTKVISANDLMWEFFQKHARTQ